MHHITQNLKTRQSQKLKLFNLSKTSPVTISARMVSEVNERKLIQNEDKQFVNYDHNDTFERALNELTQIELSRQQPKTLDINLSTTSLKTSREYKKVKSDNLLLGLYRQYYRAKAQGCELEEGFEICYEFLAKIANCTKRTAITHVKKAEALGFVIVKRSSTLKFGKSPKNKYIINIKKLHKHLVNLGVIKEDKDKRQVCKKANFHPNYNNRREIIKGDFALNKVKFKLCEVNANDFIKDNLDNFIAAMQQYLKETSLTLNKSQLVNIINTFIRVVVKDESSNIENKTLVKKLLGWFKNRCNQLLSVKDEKILKKQYSLWCAPDEFIRYRKNSIRLDDQFVENIQCYVKSTLKESKTSLSSWVPSRDLINNKCQQSLKFFKGKISEITFVKTVTTLIINSKLSNLYAEEYLL